MNAPRVSPSGRAPAWCLGEQPAGEGTNSPPGRAGRRIHRGSALAPGRQRGASWPLRSLGRGAGDRESARTAARVCRALRGRCDRPGPRCSSRGAARLGWRPWSRSTSISSRSTWTKRASCSGPSIGDGAVDERVLEELHRKSHGQSRPCSCASHGRGARDTVSIVARCIPVRPIRCPRPRARRRGAAGLFERPGGGSAAGPVSRSRERAKRLESAHHEGAGSSRSAGACSLKTPHPRRGGPGRGGLGGRPGGRTGRHGDSSDAIRRASGPTNR